jgi:hypothetical protein
MAGRSPRALAVNSGKRAMLDNRNDAPFDQIIGIPDGSLSPLSLRIRIVSSQLAG